VKHLSAIIFVISSCLLFGQNAQTPNGKVSGTVKSASPMLSVVYLTAAGKTFPAPEQHFVMDQFGLVFEPHILVVPVGSTVDFLNHDDVMHNVMWPTVSGDKQGAKNLGTFGKGDQRSFRFDKVGVAPILCNAHPQMSAYIVVIPSPYYTIVTDRFGKYKIENVPPGKYTITVWNESHEPGKVHSQEITVTGETKVDLTY
jgi:plastocyanin